MMDLQRFTLTPKAISLIGVVAGFVVMYGFLRGDVSHVWNRLLLTMTFVASVIGFFFPYRHVTRSIVLRTGQDDEVDNL